jgi:hypothetical protein
VQGIAAIVVGSTIPAGPAAGTGQPRGAGILSSVAAHRLIVGVGGLSDRSGIWLGCAYGGRAGRPLAHHASRDGLLASKTVLSAVELELFTKLGGSSLSAEEIQQQVGLHERATYDFLDSLVALGFLERDGAGRGPLPEHRRDRDVPGQAGPMYIGGILEMSLNMLIEFGDAFDYSGADFAVVPQRRLPGRGNRAAHWSRERGHRLQIGACC